MKMKQWVARCTAAFVLIAAGALAHAADFQEGKDYRRLDKPQPVETGKKIEVIEFFSFSCPHCKDMEPILEQWVKKLPADAQLRRIPAVFSPQWVGTAKVWYTLEALNEERLVPAVFNAIHGQNVRLDQDKAFFDWAAKQGLDRKKVEDMYNSFAINGKINRAKQQAQQYGVQSVPLIIVDGKYMTEVSMVGTHQQMPAAINALIAKARAERPKA